MIATCNLLILLFVPQVIKNDIPLFELIINDIAVN